MIIITDGETEYLIHMIKYTHNIIRINIIDDILMRHLNGQLQPCSLSFTVQLVRHRPPLVHAGIFKFTGSITVVPFCGYLYCWNWREHFDNERVLFFQIYEN